MKNNVEFLMAKRNIGPTELAKKLSLSRNTIQRLLRGERPSTETMLKVAKYFDVAVEDAFCIQNVLQVEQPNKKNKSA